MCHLQKESKLTYAVTLVCYENYFIYDPYITTTTCFIITVPPLLNLTVHVLFTGCVPQIALEIIGVRKKELNQGNQLLFYRKKTTHLTREHFNKMNTA